MEDTTFWVDLAKQLGINAALLAALGYVLKRWLASNMATDAAKAGALEIKDEVIKQLRMELRERDADWQLRMDRKEREFVEFRRKTQSEFETSRRIMRAVSSDMKQINAGKVPEERLDTAMLITGMGPLDLDSDGYSG